MNFVRVAKVSDIPPGTMKHAEAGGIELCIANVGGKLYAIRDRCGHENASLARGKLEGTVVICPMHHARFDIVTGRKLSDPVLELAGLVNRLGGCPENVKKEMGQMFNGIAEAQKLIRTYDRPIYEVKTDGNDVLVKV